MRDAQKYTRKRGYSDLKGDAVDEMCIRDSTYPINKYLLVKNNLEYLQTMVFILVIATFVQLVEIVLKKYMPALHKSLGVYLPLITTNCAVLGVTLLNVESKYNFFQSVLNGFGAGVGFMLAIVLLPGCVLKWITVISPRPSRACPSH